MRRRTTPRLLRARRGAGGGGGRGALSPTRGSIVLSSDIVAAPRAAGCELAAMAGRDRHPDRHPDRGQGPQLPATDPGGRGRCRSGLARRRPARGERTFQLLAQVTGRAGRAARAAGLLQTYQPEHAVMQALVAGRPRGFYEPRSWSGRWRAAAVRPAGRGDRLGRRPRPTPRSCGELGAGRAAVRPISVFGPAEAPLSLVRGRHRYRLLVQGPARMRTCRLSCGR